MKSKTISLLIPFFCITKIDAAVSIVMNFDLNENPYESAGDTTVSAENQAIFNNATAFWENVLTGYTDGVDRTVTIFASTFEQAASGGGVVLGSAGPRTTLTTGTGHTIVGEGSARFNVGQDAIGAGGLLNELVIRHEMSHILGLGTLWTNNGLYTTNSGEYTGANALAAYNNEFGANLAFIPIELDGGTGTANAHWNEVLDNFRQENQSGFDSDPGDGVAAPIVVAGVNAGESLDDELMTGVLSGSGFLGDVTIGSFQDLGFTTTAFSVPEISSTALLSLGSFLLFVRRNRRSHI